MRRRFVRVFVRREACAAVMFPKRAEPSLFRASRSASFALLHLRTQSRTPFPYPQLVPHVVLLGDSIFDIQTYTAGVPDVMGHLCTVLPASWQATLCTVDGWGRVMPASATDRFEQTLPGPGPKRSNPARRWSASPSRRKFRPR